LALPTGNRPPEEKQATFKDSRKENKNREG
jgi:hypothetical protein